MAKKILVISFIFFIISNCTAKQYGFKFGYNHSHIVGKQIKFEKWKSGYQIGLFNTFSISKKTEIQTEILYSTKGAIAISWLIDEASKTYREIQTAWCFNYIEVPILIKRTFTRPKNTLGVYLGPYLSSLRDACSKNIKAEESGIMSFSLPVKDYTNQFDYGIIGGVDYQFSIFKYRLFTDLRYSRGLNMIFKESSEVYHQLFSASLGIIF
ncbi:PorT family protein [candidate division KSB1 bacterium]|nr:PorT family protein [candidate division KSB1 bacterium]